MTISVEDHLSTLRQAPRVLVPENGRAADLGTHAVLLKEGPIYRRPWARTGAASEGAIALDACRQPTKGRAAER